MAFVNTAYGLWMPQSSEELLEQSETVFVGTIQSVNVLEFERSNTYEVEEDGKERTIIENYTQTLDEYTVSIEEFLKNPLESSTIIVTEATVGSVPGQSVSTGGFETGDRVLFYIPKLEGANQYSPESFKIPEKCDTSSVLDKPRIVGINEFTTKQNGISMHNNFIANQPIKFVFNKDMRTLDGKGFEMSVGISKMVEDRRQMIFERTIQSESNPCEWISTVKWEVTLNEGKYRVDVHETGDLRVNTSSMNINVVADHVKDFSEHRDPDPVFDLWSKHAEIIDGTIVSKTTYPGTGKGPTEFHVKVNKFFKPLSKNTESITLFASYTESDIASILNEGDRALIYVEPGNQISKYSVKVNESTYCEPRDYIQIAPVLPNDPNQLVRGPPTLPFDWKDQCVANYFTKDPNFWQYREYRPPMQQWKIHTIPIEEQRCSGEGEDFVSVQKIGNFNHKYCVKPGSILKLIERGWAITNNENTSFKITTSESKLATFYAQPQITSIILKQESTVRIHLFSYVKEPDGWDMVFNRIFDEVPDNFKIGIIGNTPENLDEFVISGKEITPSGIKAELLKENGYFVVYLTSYKSLEPGEYDLSVVSVDKKGTVIQKPLFVTVVNPDVTSINDNTVKLQFSKGSWGVNLENISELEYWLREDRRTPWPPSPILDITQDNIHLDVKEMIDAMWSEDAEYIPSEYDKKILEVKTNRDFNADPQEIRNWLESTYVQQFKRNLDDSFSSYIKYDDKIYSFEFVIAD